MRSIVILTGAGISAESGISTFRGVDGLWEDHKIEDVASPEGFARDPELVHRFYNERRKKLQSVKPNEAHVALAYLEKEWPGEVIIITQNVDDLHERAGSKNVLHMHGELLQVRCLHCGAVHRWKKDVDIKTISPCCEKPGTLRPNIVWFGEIPMEMDRIDHLLWNCDLFLSIGTSGQVFPAAGFAQQVKKIGRAKTIEFNLERSSISHQMDEGIYGKASVSVPKYVNQLLKLASSC